MPVIDSVSFSSDPGSDDTYKLADTIEVTVKFSEDVTVDTTGGEPKIDIVVGSQTRGPQYDSGSGSDELVFEYEVEDADVDANGASIRANSLDTNGGTILKLGRTLAANLAHGGVTDDDDHQVDGVAPTLSGALLNGDRLTLAYSESLATSPAPAGDDFDVQVASPHFSPMRRMMPERRRNGRRMYGEFVILRSQPMGWRAKGRKKGNSGGAKGHWGADLGTAKVAGQVQPLARCQWRRKVGEPSVASTTQWHGLEVVQDLSEQCGAWPGLGEGQLDAAHADAHPHTDLEQLVANRAALRLGQPRSGESDATQRLHQHIGERGEVQAQCKRSVGTTWLSV